MNISSKLAIVIAVHNKPQNLRFLFAAFSRQSFKNFELIIADDGSGTEIAQIVEEAKHTYGFSIIYLWQEYNGWQKNTMLNNAIRTATTDYIVFTDGDCIPGKDFVLDHFTYREQGKVLLGRRVEHGERWGKSLTMKKILSGQFEKYTIQDWIDGLQGKSLTLECGFRITNNLLRNVTGEVKSVLGSNFSTYKEHLIAVNGFDEDYHGPGCGEDSDICYRLNLIGITGKSLRNLAIQYHIYHPLTPPLQKNIERFEQVQFLAEPRCKNGLKKL